MQIVCKCEAIGTHWFFSVDENLITKWQNIQHNVLAILYQFEQCYSRFISTSVVSKINDGDFNSPLPQDLQQMLSFGYKLQQVTEGAFSLGVGSVLNYLGYNSSYEFKVAKKIPLQHPYIVFNDEKLELHNGAQLDLGSLGKGFLVDKIAAFLHSKNIDEFIINAGGDILVSSVSPQKIILQHPAQPTLSIGTSLVFNGACAASSPSQRNWKHPASNNELHHIVSLQKLEPISEIAGVFVQAESTFLADALSTAFFVSPRKIHQTIQATFPCEYALFFPDESFWYSKNFNIVLH